MECDWDQLDREIRDWEILMNMKLIAKIRDWDPAGMAGRSLSMKITYTNLSASLRSLLHQES